MKIIGIIPSRMESIRLPGKPLLKIGEKTMIQRVYESAKKCKELDELFVDTPNKKDLLAANLNLENMRKLINATTLTFLSSFAIFLRISLESSVELLSQNRCSYV